MKDFLLSEDVIDEQAVRFINREGESYGLLSVYWVHFNDRVKMEFFTDGLVPLSERQKSLSLDQACGICKQILARVIKISEVKSVSLENVIWDAESIFTDSSDHVFLICLPAIVPLESIQSAIYAKRVYSLIEDMLAEREDGGFVCRQVGYQQSKNFGDWKGLMSTLNLRETEEDENAEIVLRSINTPSPCEFIIRQRRFRIGSDPGEVEGPITEVDTIDPVHAEIGWNGINYYVVDLGSEHGTYVNDRRIAPHMEIPIGQGTVLRFADYTFNVE
ncbi:MAG: FHA domain-containing protein [Bilifractor sp.]|jgi:hypothetical protein